MIGRTKLIQEIRGYPHRVIHTENLAGGANWEFPKCRGGEVYTIY